MQSADCTTCGHSHSFDGPLKPLKPVDTPCWKCGCNDFKPHRCETPATGMPLDEWTCPVCDKRWWATLEWPNDEYLEWHEQLTPNTPIDRHTS
jgi:predicted  nucleic acid-binding Zn-ribbon protein